jgi:16S rRNA (cytosine967-C5)-methyltransferase
VTCSVLPEENDDALAELLERRRDFHVTPVAETLAQAGFGRLRNVARLTRYGLQMTPRLTQTDGFYVAMIKRRKETES